MSNNKPVHRIRLSTISAAIFKNETNEGKTFYNATVDRSYKDGEQWKHTGSFSRDDLLNVSKVADLANSWIHQKEQSESQSNVPEPT